MVPTLNIRPTRELASETAAPAGENRILKADPTLRVAVEFQSDGIRLAGHLYRSLETAVGSSPAVVLCGPISNVKELTVPHYAERLAQAGFTALTFDPRGFGESDVAPLRPRWHYDPGEVIADYSNAVSYLRTLPEVDKERIAAVGICMGGGYAVSLGARDHRVKVVVSIAGGTDCGVYLRNWLGDRAFGDYLLRINELQQREYETGEPQYVPSIARALTAETPVAIMPFAGAYDYYAQAGDEAPQWSSRMTAASLPAWFSYSALPHAPLLGSTPLLVVHGTRDIELPPEYMEAVYAAAPGPKQFTWVKSHSHFEFYNQDPYVSQCAQTVVEWLRKHLGQGVGQNAKGIHGAS